MSADARTAVTRIFAAGLLAAAVAASAATAPPAAENDSPGLFFDSLDVHIVNVDVYVTGRDGTPVSGLTADDFELYEDGRRVPITNFYAVEEGRRRRPASAPAADPPAAAPAAPESAVAVVGEPEAAPVPDDQRLHLIVYFDNLQLRPFSRNRVVREVRRFLADRLADDDRVMVVSFERSLHVRQPFTSDLQRVFTALDGLQKLSAFAVQAGTDRDEVVRRVEAADTLAAAQGHVDFYAEAAFRDVGDSIKALKELVSSLGGLPGRKALLYVSDGLPMTPGQDLYHLLDLRFPELSSGQLGATRFGARSRFRELVARANANRVTFYTLEATGARGHSSLSAASAGSAAGGSLLEVDFMRDANLVEPLQMMALDTGGQASFNTNNLAGALDRLAADLGSYYSLGYEPAHHGDGRYHRLEVKLAERRRGLSVRHRNGYRDKTLETRLADGVLASLLHGAERDPLGLEVALGTPRRRDDGYFLVPLEVSIPLGEVTLVPAGGTSRGRLRVVLAVADGEGATSPPEQTEVPLTVPTAEVEAARRQRFVYAAELLMRPGLHEVAVGVHDELAGATSFVRKPVYVGG